MLNYKKKKIITQEINKIKDYYGDMVGKAKLERIHISKEDASYLRSYDISTEDLGSLIIHVVGLSETIMERVFNIYKKVEDIEALKVICEETIGFVISTVQISESAFRIYEGICANREFLTEEGIELSSWDCSRLMAIQDIMYIADCLIWKVRMDLTFFDMFFSRYSIYNELAEEIITLAEEIDKYNEENGYEEIREFISKLLPNDRNLIPTNKAIDKNSSWGSAEWLMKQNKIYRNNKEWYEQIEKWSEYREYIENN